ETLCCGDSSATDPGVAPWLTAHDFSDADEPIVRLPAGIATISGHSGQSRNTSPLPPSEFVVAGVFRCLLSSYTSRIALITVCGSSNWIYSELLRAKTCLAFEDSPSQRAWASVVSCSYLRCSGVSGGFLSTWPTPWFPEVSTRMGREPNERRCCCR